MRPIKFDDLLNWIINEYKNYHSIFGIAFEKFYFKKNYHTLKIFNQNIETPVGPAAGPHTQLAQNIISAYLVGGRFIELKTVQVLDDLRIDKPCIDAEDEGFNVEWSQELSLVQSNEEYVKAWILIHILNKIFHFSPIEDRAFIFNMSVGYNLEGIKSTKMDDFINQIKDASQNEFFNFYKADLTNKLKNGSLLNLLKNGFGIEHIVDDEIEECIECLENISPNISNSVTLSTMHGCPPYEIESISKYLIKEKGLHTYVKLNPTLLGFDFVKDTLHSLGYSSIALDENSFNNDLQFKDAILMLSKLTQFAKDNGKEFGIKLSNTLGTKNTKYKLHGNEMFLSGRALFPLTINLAYILSEEFNGQLNISFSGGSSIHNVKDILATGIYPVTMVTELLKPGGYERLLQIANEVNDEEEDEIRKPEFRTQNKEDGIDVEKLRKLAESSLNDHYYKKESREVTSIKINKSLPIVDCYVPPCTEGCPIHQDIPEYIRLIEEKRYNEAFELIISKNPLPHITGYICDHQCMLHCTRWDYDTPVLIRDLKRFAAEKGYNSYWTNFNNIIQKEFNNVKVAIIGAGPSGLSAGYFLAKAGFDVTIFEKTQKAGGTVQHIIPNFRIPQSAIENDINLIKAFGVKFQFGSKVNQSIDELKKDGFSYIYIAIGAGKSKTLKLDGKDTGIYDSIDFLTRVNNREIINLGYTVAVIGGGNSAMDSARAAMRCKGVDKVYIIYRRTKDFMPADKEEFQAALQDRIIFRDLLTPISFTNGKLKCQKMKLDIIDTDGRRKVIPIENSFEEVETDSIISAIGEEVDLDILNQNGIYVYNNIFTETNLENVYIGGDALRGPATVIEAIADGRKTADAIILKENLERSDNHNHIIDSDLLESDIRERKGFITPQNKTDLLSESKRCLGCNFICNKCIEVCPNRANIEIKMMDIPIPRFLYSQIKFKDKYQILHIDGICNECGNCETFCPYNGSPYKEKLTLYWSEENFANSKNDGFIFLSKPSDNIIAFRIRIKTGEGIIRYDKINKLIKWDSNLVREENLIKYINIAINVHNHYPYLMIEK
jgi:putative selenate reductase